MLNFKKDIPTIQYVNFEHCNCPMEVGDDEINEMRKSKNIMQQNINKCLGYS